MVKLRGLGTDVTDKMILKYVESMGTIKREVVGWEKYRGESFLEGLATGTREVVFTHKEGLELPVFHRINGRRVQIEVEGHRDCYNCHMSSKQCPARRKTRDYQKLNSGSQRSWQTHLKGFLEEIKTTEQELWREQILIGEEMIEVVEMEEDGKDQEVDDTEKKDTSATTVSKFFSYYGYCNL